MVDFKCQFLTFIPSSRSSENFGEVGKVVIILLFLVALEFSRREPFDIGMSYLYMAITVS